MASRVNTWPIKTALTGTESIAIDDTTHQRITTKDLFVRVASISNSNFCVNATISVIDPQTQRCVITAPGDPTHTNKIGAQSSPVGTDNTNPGDWADDTAYPSGGASVATISGGYDMINNQLAGTITGGGHNYMQYNVNGHSFMGGGSYNWINAGRATIVAGTDNRVTGATSVYSAVLGGFQNSIEGNSSHSTVIGGSTNTINTTTANHLAYGVGNLITSSQDHCITIGHNHTISGASSYAAHVGGLNNARTGSGYGAALGGRNNTQSGSYSVALAADNSDDNGSQHAVMRGKQAVGMAGIGVDYVSPGQITAPGDSMSFTGTQNTRTNTQQANPQSTIQHIRVPIDGAVHLTVSIQSVCYNETSGATASFAETYSVTWAEGSTNPLFNGSGTEPSITEIYNPDSMIAPKLAGNTRQLRHRAGYQTDGGDFVRTTSTITGTILVAPNA